MYCKYCGAPLPENSKFCPTCGQSLENNIPQEPAEAYNEIPAEVKEDPIADTEISDPWETPADPWAEPAAPAEEVTPDNEERPVTEEIPTESIGFEEPPLQEQPLNDPFSGPAHPSVKKNIIIACVVLGIATIISVILMGVGMVKMATSDAFLETVTEDGIGQSYSDSLNDNTDLDIVINDTFDEKAGNTANNIINSGLAVADGNGGVYYTELNEVFLRSDSDNTELILQTDADYIGGLNLNGNKLYYTTGTPDENLYQALCYDLNTATEITLWETDEIIYYGAYWDGEYFVTTTYDIYAINAEDQSVRTVLQSDYELCYPRFGEEGLYYAIRDTEDDSLNLYRSDFNGEGQELIANGWWFSYDQDTLYINNVDDQGYDIIETADLNGEGKELLYTFEEQSTSVIEMSAENGILYCITTANGDTTDYVHEVRIIDPETNESSLIDKDFTEEENPFYFMNVAGGHLFYIDDTFIFGIRICDLEDL